MDFLKYFMAKLRNMRLLDCNSETNLLQIKKFDNGYSYKIYTIFNARLYTDTINDTAIIKNNKVISGPSFQIRNVKFEEVDKNIVFSKGTPRFKKRIKGNLFSLLTGGAGNHNYWHWMFDVLPRINGSFKYNQY